MKYILLLVAAGLCAAPAIAQGVDSEWDVRTMVSSLQRQEQHLRPLLDQVKPDTWVANGAPEAYIAQWKSTRAELNYLFQTSDAFLKQPERLTLALDTYFRMQSIDSMLASLVQGIRKYQSPAVAQQVQNVINETSMNRDKLREYIRELALQKEQEFQVADREAQRCRGVILKQPAGRRGENK